jgi:hypothetical protein
MKNYGLSLAMIGVTCLTAPTAIAQTKAIQKTTQKTATIPAGTEFEGKLQEDLSTAKNQNQDRFLLRVQKPIFGGEPLLKDTQVQGHLEQVVKAAKGQKAKMNLVFDDIIFKNGSRSPLNVTLLNSKVQTKTKGTFLRNTGIIVAGAVAGRYIGKKTGVPLGTTGGIAAASAYVLNSPGGQVVLKKGTKIELKLNKPLAVGIR